MPEELVSQFVSVRVYRLGAGCLWRHPDVICLLRRPPQATWSLEARRKRFTVQDQGSVVVFHGGLVQRLERQGPRHREVLERFGAALPGNGV